MKDPWRACARSRTLGKPRFSERGQRPARCSWREVIVEALGRLAVALAQLRPERARPVADGIGREEDERVVLAHPQLELGARLEHAQQHRGARRDARLLQPLGQAGEVRRARQRQLTDGRPALALDAIGGDVVELDRNSGGVQWRRGTGKREPEQRDSRPRTPFPLSIPPPCSLECSSPTRQRTDSNVAVGAVCDASTAAFRPAPSLSRAAEKCPLGVTRNCPLLGYHHTVKPMWRRPA